MSHVSCPFASLPLLLALGLGAAGCATDKVTGESKFSLVN